MDTCGLERVERFRIKLNEKNFASQKNTLTSSFRKDAEPLAPAAAAAATATATIRWSMYPTSVLLRKGLRIRVAPGRSFRDR
jgi:hypothetical protein